MDKMNLSGRDSSKLKGRCDGTNYSFERDRSYGFSWPQRNYNCNFCKKEFKSAQALGGHMNVHRRDRAKQLLAQQHSSSSSSSELHYSNPNPKPINDHHQLFFSPPHTTSSPKPPPTSSRFFKFDQDDDDDDTLAVSPQIREIRKKLAVEANYNRNYDYFKGNALMKNDESRVHKKNNNHFLGLDLNLTTSTTGNDDEDLDLELRLGSF